MYQVMCDSFFPVTQLEELEEGRRKLQQRDRELSQLAESLSRVQAYNERKEEELQRMKKGESWTRRSISPSSSSEEVNAVVSNYTQQLSDMYAEKYNVHILSPSLLPPPSSLLPLLYSPQHRLQSSIAIVSVTWLFETVSLASMCGGWRREWGPWRRLGRTW